MIRIYPPAYWDLLQIRRNKTLYVEESTSVMISRDILEVSAFEKRKSHRNSVSDFCSLFYSIFSTHTHTLTDCASQHITWRYNILGNDITATRLLGNPIDNIR